MKKLIIIEGPDGGGKTTLADYLHSMLGSSCVRFHVGPPKDDEEDAALTQYTRILESITLLPEHFVIFDRFHLGEHAYGPVVRGKDTLGHKGRQLIESKMRTEFDPIMVVCLPRWSTVMNNWHARHGTELVKEPEKMQSVYKWYAETLPLLTTIPHTYYDYTKGDQQDVYRLVTR